MNVLHLFRYFRPDFTGEGLYLEKLDPLLRSLGITSEVAAEFTRTRPGSAPGRLAARLFGRAHTPWFNPALLIWLSLNVWRFDVVHIHSAIDRLFLYHLVARLGRCRVVHSCTLDDGLGRLLQGYRPAYRGLVRRLCGLIDDVVTISPGLYADTIGVGRPGRVHLIPQGAALPALRADRTEHRKRFGFGTDETVLLFVGGLCARKDVAFLVEHHPLDLGPLHLLLVGPVLEENYVEALTAAIAASPAAARIHLAGYLEDPVPAYRAADVFVFASLAEGFGNVLLEAMAHGLPVICRRLPGITDSFIAHGESGLLFDTAAEYNEAVRRLAADPAARDRLGRAARAVVAADYDIEAVAARYAAIYEGAK